MDSSFTLQIPKTHLTNLLLRIKTTLESFSSLLTSQNHSSTSSHTPILQNFQSDYTILDLKISKQKSSSSYTQLYKDLIKLKCNIEEYLNEEGLLLEQFRANVLNSIVKEHGGTHAEAFYEHDEYDRATYLKTDFEFDESKAQDEEYLYTACKRLRHLNLAQKKAYDLKLEMEQEALQALKEENELLKSKFTQDELESFTRQQSKSLQKKLTIRNQAENDDREEISDQALKELIEDKCGKQRKGSTYVMDDTFTIDLSRSWTKELIRELAHHYYLPSNIKNIYVYYLNKGNTSFKMLLGCSIRYPINTLGVNDYALSRYKKNKLPISEYLPCLQNVNLKENLWLFHFQISSLELSELIKASHKLTGGVSFRYGSLQFDDILDFGNRDYSISYLSIRDCNLDIDPDYSLSLLAGSITDSSLAKSLTEIRTHGIEMDKDEIEVVLRNYKLQHITVNHDSHLKVKA